MSNPNVFENLGSSLKQLGTSIGNLFQQDQPEPAAAPSEAAAITTAQLDWLASQEAADNQPDDAPPSPALLAAAAANHRNSAAAAPIQDGPSERSEGDGSNLRAQRLKHPHG